MRVLTFSIGASTLVASWLFGSVALASDGYAIALQTKLGLDCAPQCTICHTTNAGGLGTVTKPFGTAMVGPDDDIRLRFRKPEQIGPAVDALEQEGTDSDSDGASDIQELRDGVDPNPGDSALCGGPTYGCGATIASRPETVRAESALAALVGLGLFGAWRRQRRRTQRRPARSA